MKVVEGSFVTHKVLEFVSTAILEILVTYTLKEMISSGFRVAYIRSIWYNPLKLP